jgi:hypothetical protein
MNTSADIVDRNDTRETVTILHDAGDPIHQVVLFRLWLKGGKPFHIGQVFRRDNIRWENQSCQTVRKVEYYLNLCNSISCIRACQLTVRYWQ